MKLLEQQTELAAVTALKPHPRNANRGDLGAILESVRENGFFGSVIAQRSTGHILAGTHRYLAAIEDGATELPVTWLEVDDARALKIMLADNRTARLGHDDEAALAALLKELAEGPGLIGTGFDGDDLDELLADLAGPGGRPGEDPGPDLDRADDLREQWGTAHGQLWVIPSLTSRAATHRLLCGDSTDPANVARLVGDRRADLLFTDPPYGVDAVGGTRDPRDTRNFGSGNRIVGDALPDPELEALVTKALANAALSMTPGAAYYVWHPSTKCELFARSVTMSLAPFRGVVVWAKPNFVFGRADYHWQHEPCFYGWVPGAAHRWRGTRDQGTVWTTESVGTDLQKKLHPTAKPVGLAEKAIGNHLEHSHAVLDVFGGSGSTAVAAERLGRSSLTLEYEPKYVAVILERLAGMGLEPRLESP